MAMNFERSTVAISGRFADWSKADLEILLKSRGAWRVAGAPSKGVLALLSAEVEGKNVDKASALGIPVILADGVREALGPALGGFRQRLERLQADPTRNTHDHTFVMGAPVAPEVLARVEERIGFALPEEARTLWSQLDGLSWLWANRPIAPGCRDTPLAWSQACHGDGPLWGAIHACKEKGDWFHMGMVAIPPVETIFFTKWDGMMFSSDAFGARDKIKLGRRSVNARKFFANLFLFDLFHPYYQAGLWADEESGQLSVVYASDHGADWGMAAAVPLEIYMESILVEKGAERPIALTSKLGATRAIVNYAHKPYVVLSPYRDM